MLRVPPMEHSGCLGLWASVWSYCLISAYSLPGLPALDLLETVLVQPNVP